MKGESNLEILLKNMNPILNIGEYVFCTTKKFNHVNKDCIINLFKEKEGYTLILKKEDADIYGFSYSSVMAWITLKVHSSLEAVGLTAAFSKQLADNMISCNVIAGYYHDHIFIPIQKAEEALNLLDDLKNSK